ncbi:MAG: cytochrome c [Deltaproteobacteria bacterium]|jgi:mono/diheme cytochrome c family protein|nr:cytochrome c [Deltaproteobacteria bacterium]MCL5879772.1 cytochrome c [Deltaproteobacteria bacterium]
MKRYIFFVMAFCMAAIFFISNFAFALPSGPKLFKEYYCIDCHTLGHQGGTVGPDLSYVGKTKSFSWIKAQILNPDSHFILGEKKEINGKIYLTRMPGFAKTIPSSVVNKLAGYIKSFPYKRANLAYKKPPKGLLLFRADNCVACHRINGVGGTVGPNLSHIGKTKSLSWIETQIVAPSVHFTYGIPATINGHTYLVIMPELKNIPASQLNTIARYLESLK